MHATPSFRFMTGTGSCRPKIALDLYIRRFPGKRFTTGGCVKTFLTLLALAPVGIAAINGRVTDATGTTAIAGALVQLENTGQQATTDSNGDFTIATTVNVNRTAALPQQSISATQRNGILLLRAAERTHMEIAVYDLSGRMLGRERRTLDAGVWPFTAPAVKSGVLLYRISHVRGEMILKGRMVGGTFANAGKTIDGTPVTGVVVQQAKTATAINDVLATTKEGYLNYRMRVTNSDTSGIAINMIACAGTIMDGDGNVYQTVAIGKQTWTTENLRATKFIDGTPITSEYWDDYVKEPRFCYSGFRPNAKYIKQNGALYNWYVVDPANPKKIAPVGWHVPSNADWDNLQEYLVANGYNYDGSKAGNKVAKSLAAQADWPASVKPGAVGNDLTRNNRTGFSAYPGGNYLGGDFDDLSDQGLGGCWWSATKDSDGTCYDRSLYSNYELLIYHINIEYFGNAIRLVKD